MGCKVLIFCSTKRCDALSIALARQIGCASIHGDKDQREREAVMRDSLGRNPILVVTDAAARGLDIKDIQLVVNYDFLPSIEDYIHRIGRTGRAGASGVAVTLIRRPMASTRSRYSRSSTTRSRTRRRCGTWPLGRRRRRRQGGGGGKGGGRRQGGGGGGGKGGGGGSMRGACTATHVTRVMCSL